MEGALVSPVLPAPWPSILLARALHSPPPAHTRTYYFHGALDEAFLEATV